MTENHITVNNSIIFYSVIGEGSPVVLIHGFAEDSTVWEAQVLFLKNNFRLIIPDLPGTRKSQLLQKENAGIDDYADCIHQILQNENINQCIMIGHSMGGYITLAFAEKYPSILKAFGLFHSSAYADDDEKIATRKKAISFIQENGAEQFLKTSIPGLFYDIQKNRQQIDELLTKGKAFTPPALIQYYKAMIARPDRTEVLKSFPGPVLFIMGVHDKAVLFVYSLQQCHMPGQSHIHVLRNSAHMGMQEETRQANNNLKNFLQSI